MTMDMFNALSMIWFIMMIAISEGDVVIQKPFHPYYIKEGNNLELTCTSTDRIELQWLHNTPEDQWEQTIIEPTQGNNFVIRTTLEEPSGNVKSVLVKNHMNIDDRGTYKCQDITKENVFSIWVTVLKIKGENVTAVKDEPATLFCHFSGMDQNPPGFEYAWYYDDLFIPRDHPRYFMTKTESGSGISLKIHEPVKADIGRYNCVFMFATNIGGRELTHGVHFDGPDLPVGSASHVTPMLTLTVILTCWSIWR